MWIADDYPHPTELASFRYGIWPEEDEWWYSLGSNAYEILLVLYGA